MTEVSLMTGHAVAGYFRAFIKLTIAIFLLQTFQQLSTLYFLASDVFLEALSETGYGWILPQLIQSMILSVVVIFALSSLATLIEVHALRINAQFKLFSHRIDAAMKKVRGPLE